MRSATGHRDAARSVVFAPLDEGGRAVIVERRLADAITTGVLSDGERLPSEAELARSLGVAVVTAREALEGLRGRGLVQTRRGREGGSFVTYDVHSAADRLEQRLQEHSRVQLRDIALHVGAIAGTAAEVAADRASDDDLATLTELVRDADRSTPGSARRTVGQFQLEVAAVSQSPRLVRESVRLQAEAGPLLWLCLREPEYRDRSATAQSTITAAIRDADPAAARAATLEHIGEALDWLIEHRYATPTT
ncbi:FadR/GntR family transcriptional regulator [Microbacterium gorillae]|uniref:FadR/GntR family transcriptional regulator n=1 Tax=Microbacterium gorillae TaxID=1231063 RepID=UPI00058E4300|nr:GntR family transcriptional regulator [Microbacterium gorillae]